MGFPKPPIPQLGFAPPAERQLEPSGAKKTTGYADREPFPARHQNWILASISAWLRWAEQSIDQVAGTSVAVLGTPAQVAAGLASHSAPQAAYDAAVAAGGGKVAVLAGTIAGNLSMGSSNGVIFEGAGVNSILTGNVQVSGQNNALRDMLLTGSLTLTAPARANDLQVKLAATSAFTDLAGTRNHYVLPRDQRPTILPPRYRLNPQVSSAEQERLAANWQTRNPTYGDYWQGSAYSSVLHRFVYVGLNSGNSTAVAGYSDNGGITFTQLTQGASLPAGQWISVAYSPELRLFVAVANGGTNRAMSSPDGITWTARTAPAQIWRSVTWSGRLSLFVAVGHNAIMTSVDGITWNTVSDQIGLQWTSVCDAPELGLLVAVAQNASGPENDRVMTSPDGVTWTGRLANSDSNLRKVIWAAELGLLIAVGGTGTNRIIYSADGSNWQPASVPQQRTWQDVAWSPELGFLAVTAFDGGAITKIATSTDGISFVNRAYADTAQLQLINWLPHEGIFLVLAGLGGGTPVVATKMLRKLIAP